LAPRRQNQRGEGPRLRLEIMQAAMRILDRAPATQLSLRMVAKEAGVTPPAVYAHFPDAKTMMIAIASECWRQLADEMSLASRKAGPASAFASLKIQVGAYVRYAMGRPSRYQLLFAFYPIDAETSRYLPRPAEPVYLKVNELIDRFVAEGGALPAPDSHAATMLVLALTHGRIALAHTTPDRPWNQPEEVAGFVTEILDRLFVI
jgi:AcrR family transcriptional regulator